jgi:hypothetical protein
VNAEALAQAVVKVRSILMLLEQAENQGEARAPVTRIALHSARVSATNLLAVLIKLRVTTC